MRQQHKLMECAACGALVENLTKHQRWHEDHDRLLRPLPGALDQLRRRVDQLWARVDQSR